MFTSSISSCLTTYIIKTLTAKEPYEKVEKGQTIKELLKIMGKPNQIEQKNGETIYTYVDYFIREEDEAHQKKEKIYLVDDVVTHKEIYMEPVPLEKRLSYIKYGIVLTEGEINLRHPFTAVQANEVAKLKRIEDKEKKIRVYAKNCTFTCSDVSYLMSFFKSPYDRYQIGDLLIPYTTNLEYSYLFEKRLSGAYLAELRKSLNKAKGQEVVKYREEFKHLYRKK